jgi:hypothetical protein
LDRHAMENPSGFDSKWFVTTSTMAYYPREVRR